MVRAERVIDINDKPDLLRVIEEVEASGEAASIERDGKRVVRIVPIRQPRRRPPAKVMKADDPLWQLIGKFRSHEPTDVGDHKHEYIAEAIENKGKVDG